MGQGGPKGDEVGDPPRNAQAPLFFVQCLLNLVVPLRRGPHVHAGDVVRLAVRTR